MATPVLFKRSEHLLLGESTLCIFPFSFRKLTRLAKSPSLETMTAWSYSVSNTSRATRNTKSASQFPFGTQSPSAMVYLKTRTKLLFEVPCRDLYKLAQVR